MESTNLFNSNKEISDLKKKLYERYSMDFNTIKPIIQNALEQIYGIKHSTIISKKLNQIHLINYFDTLDFFEYFEIDYSKSYPANVHFPDDLLDDFEVLEDLNDLFEDIEKNSEETVNLNEDNIEITEKHNLINDEDASLYYAHQHNYSTCLFADYANKINSCKLSDEDRNKLELEELYNSSMFSCAKEELKKLNLLFDSPKSFEEFVNKMNSKKVVLLDNVNNDFEPVHLIFINPLKFSKDDVFTLIKKIVLAINTALSTQDNDTFIFNCGLNDIYTKSLSKNTIVYEENKHKFLTTSIANNITIEILDYLNSNNLNIYGYTNLSTPKYYFDQFDDYTQFYTTYKEFILESLITNNNNILFDRIGEINFIEFVNESFEYYEELYYSSSYHLERFTKALEMMKNYNNN